MIKGGCRLLELGVFVGECWVVISIEVLNVYLKDFVWFFRF